MASIKLAVIGGLIKLLKSYNPGLPMGPGMTNNYLVLRDQLDDWQQPVVVIEETTKTKNGHTGVGAYSEYSVKLGQMTLRVFSEHGDMANGYFGSNARACAFSYANQLCEELGTYYALIVTKSKKGRA